MCQVFKISGCSCYTVVKFYNLVKSHKNGFTQLPYLQEKRPHRVGFFLRKKARAVVRLAIQLKKPPSSTHHLTRTIIILSKRYVWYFWQFSNCRNRFCGKKETEKVLNADVLFLFWRNSNIWQLFFDNTQKITNLSTNLTPDACVKGIQIHCIVILTK